MVNCNIVYDRIHFIKQIVDLKDIGMGRKKTNGMQRSFSSEEKREFSLIYQEYQPFLLRYVRAIVKDKDLSEDIVQETFCEVLDQFEKFREHPNQKGWLIRTAGYKMREISRKMNSKELIPLQEDMIQPIKNDIAYEMKELDIVMSEAFDENEREHFLKYYLRGYSVRELADKEGVTENSMRVKLYRLKEKLRRLISPVLVLCVTVNYVFIQWIGK